jgi:diacylglycerol kinase family enzyme
MGIPRRIGPAFAAHLRGRRARVDIGRANGEPMLLMAGIGWDAEIVARVGAAAKRRFGEAAYIAAGLRALPALPLREVSWTAGDESRCDRLGVMVVSNTRLYGGRLRPSPGASAVDGLLDVVALAPQGPGGGLRLAFAVLRRALEGRTDVIARRAARVAVHTPGIPYQLDGDHAGVTPVEITVDPQALVVSLPAGRLPEVLRAATNRG